MSAKDAPLDPEGIGATIGDVERLLQDTFAASQHEKVRQELRRLEHAPLVTDAERLKVAALIVAGGSWPRLVDAVELGLVDWRDLLVSAFYGDSLR